MFAIFMSKKGRAGLALPFDALLTITTFGVTLFIMALSLVIWPLFAFWTQACWIITIGTVILWTRKVIRAYREGKAS